MDIKFDSNNFRKHSDKNKKIIKKSLKELGPGRSILIDNDNIIIAGNGVYEQAQKLKINTRIIETDGRELIVLKRTDLTNDSQQRKELALIDNKATDLSEFDFDIIPNYFDIDELKGWGFDEFDLGLQEEEKDNSKKEEKTTTVIEIMCEKIDKDELVSWLEIKLKEISISSMILKSS